MRKHKLAFVLSGGGARGALQAGALHAFLERGIYPDLLVGTSAGAINSAFLGIDPSLAQVVRLEQAWREAAQASFLPANWHSIVTRALLNRAGIDPNPRLREFFIAHLPKSDLRFGELRVPVYLVAADLNHAQLVIYGEDPEQSVLEGLLASTALPPWARPVERGDQLLMDGGVVSNLPVQAAVQHGATELVAFDLCLAPQVLTESRGLGSFAGCIVNTVTRRQAELEMQWAAARGISVHHLELHASFPVMFWDFAHADELIAQGFQTAKRFLDETWPAQPVKLSDWARGWWRRKRQWLRVSSA